ncbi:MAG TPA: regulatory protein RecX [Candidatus Acidoferrum sp.]|nr:regulatory protein RecX [Candidatus Acidoferrum sp.]
MSGNEGASGLVTRLKFTRSGGVVVEVDGEVIGEVDPAEFSRSRGDMLTADEIEAVRLLARRFDAHMKAARSLARQSSSERGLVTRLRKKGVDPTAAAEAARYYAGRGYIDDMAFAKNKADELHSRKNYGRRRIAAELARLGVPQEAAKAALEALPPDSEAIARAVARHRMGDLSDRNERARQWRHFSAQGFAAEDIRAALAGGDDFEEEYFDD